MGRRVNAIVDAIFPGFSYDRRKCDYCGRWIGVNVRAQHMRAKHYPSIAEPKDDGAIVNEFGDPVKQ